MAAHERADRVAPGEEGGRKAELRADLDRLADTELEDGGVELVVEHERADPHEWLGLSEAVDAPVTLLQTIRVPRQLVMNDLRRGMLEVQPFRDGVGRDQDGA